jgi:phosphopantothenoylcysteine decarboxylase/phosphopantothenate--cysteine ligase
MVLDSWIPRTSRGTSVWGFGRNDERDHYFYCLTNMPDFKQKNILLGICGGIAAYKSAHLVRELCRLGANVQVVMTEAAHEFITPMTLQALSGQAVRSKLFDAQAERAMGHIELARWADLLLIAPASAHCIAALAQGLADDLLSTLYLVTERPVILCPAMNRSMWAHPATQSNCQLLLERGVRIIGPDEGSQACGEVGLGRMTEVLQIIDALRLYELPPCLKGQNVLITAGPTREAIDPVRYLSNHSSGKMGYALAHAALMAGADVTLISGPTALEPPAGVKTYFVESAESMLEAVLNHLQNDMIFIGAAAVADYSVQLEAGQKIKKHDRADLSLDLKLNPDIIATVAATKKAAYVVGFAAETQDVLAHARAKREAKSMDMIIANQVGNGLGFGRDEHQVTVITADGESDIAMMHKTRLAGQLIVMIAKARVEKR